MTAEGEGKALCEEGVSKNPAEQDYIFVQPQLLARGAFDRVIAAQKSYGLVFPEYQFREKFVIVAERPYFLMANLVAPQEQRKLDGSYKPDVIFSFANLRGPFENLEERMGIENLQLANQDMAAAQPNAVVIEGNGRGTDTVLTWNASHAFRDQLFRTLPGALALSILMLWAIIHFLGRIGRLQDSLVASEAEMRRIALHDGLTGLPNRTHLHKLLAQAIAKVTEFEPIYIGIFDLDHFKAVNDTYGHDIGDRLILRPHGARALPWVPQTPWLVSEATSLRSFSERPPTIQMPFPGLPPWGMQSDRNSNAPVIP